MIDPQTFFESIRLDKTPIPLEEGISSKATSDFKTFESLNFPSFPKRTIPAYYIPPASVLQQPVTGVYNSCGQCVMATLLNYWNVTGYDINEVERIWKSGNGAPDIAGGVLGTSWERVRDYLQYRGMNGFGGCEQRLTVWSADGKFEWLSGWVNNGYPVGLIVGNGELSPGESGAHWVIVNNINPNDVVLHNMGSSSYTVDTPTFMKAWQAAGLPWTHYASVVMYK